MDTPRLSDLRSPIRAGGPWWVVTLVLSRWKRNRHASWTERRSCPKETRKIKTNTPSSRLRPRRVQVGLERHSYIHFAEIDAPITVLVPAIETSTFNRCAARGPFGSRKLKPSIGSISASLNPFRHYRL